MNNYDEDKVPPFLPEEPLLEANSSVNAQGALGYVSLLLSVSMLVIALVGGGRMILDILIDGKGLANTLNPSLLAKILALILAYLLGLGAAGMSERVFGNFFTPIVLKVFSWVLLLLVCGVYGVIIYKLFNQGYTALKYFLYIGILFAGLGAFAVLHLFMGTTDMRPYALPLLAVSVFQAIEVVYRYVFVPNQDKAMLIFADFYFLIMMFALEALMIAHLGILDRPRRAIQNFFVWLPEYFRRS
jgi:hypothetical protein